jgi:hypothetical protein
MNKTDEIRFEDELDHRLEDIELYPVLGLLYIAIWILTLIIFYNQN